MDSHQTAHADFLYQFPIFSELETIYQKPTVNGHNNGTSFKSYFTVGMNSKSKVQDEAWNFIKFMLSEDMQSLPMVMGFAMHKGVAEKQLIDGASTNLSSDHKVVSISVEEFDSYMSFRMIRPHIGK